MKSTVSKWGNSLAIRIPKKIMDEYHVKAGDKVNYDIEGNRMIIEFAEEDIKDEAYDLDDLFKDFHGTYDQKEIDWGKPEGREVW